jgi:SAM-dependent methyltransferase
MRGPLLSGVLGSAATLRRLPELLRGRGPVAILSSLWLASTLAAELPVLALIAGREAGAGRRALRKARAANRALGVVVTGQALPLHPGSLGAVVLEDVASVDPDALVGHLLEVTALLRPGGALVALDRTKDPRVEARLAAACVASALVDIGQQRPRDGALITSGRAAPPAVRAAFIAARTAPIEVDDRHG